MAFPTGTEISTDNLDSATADPSLARSDLFDAVTAVNDIIASANEASGVLVLTGTGKIPSGIMPDSITLPDGVQIINPASGFVNIRNVLRLQQQTKSQVDAITEMISGDVVFVTNGNAGAPCLAVYNGTSWLRIALGAAIATT
jgi:hypothetical protein